MQQLNSDIKEHEDGSATLTVDFTPEQQQALMRSGMLHALEQGIKQGQALDPDTLDFNLRYIEFTQDQTTKIVQHELEQIYYTATPEVQLAIYVLLEYISTPQEFEQWTGKHF